MFTITTIACGSGASRQQPGQDAGVDSNGPPDAAPSDASTLLPQSDICARYVACATAVQPASAASILEAYGPMGLCWSSTATVAADCTTACRAGVGQLHPMSPTACPNCVGDGECGGATPACDAVAGECVTCTTNANCAAGVCDTSAHACVECLADRDCTTDALPVCDTSQHRCVAGCVKDAQCPTAARPHCALDYHTCVECTTDDQCDGNPGGPICYSNDTCGCSQDNQCGTGGECPQQGRRCCTPAQTCDPGWCSIHLDQCNVQHDCGACAVGDCRGGICNAAGYPCTPGGNDCGLERCMFNSSTHAYVCQKDEENKQCLYAQDCSFLAGNQLPTYTCLSGGGFGTCQSYCLTTVDCNAGETCMQWGSEPISPTSPGLCRQPLPAQPARLQR